MIAKKCISRSVDFAKPLFYIVILTVGLYGCVHSPPSPERPLFSTGGKISIRQGTKGSSGRFSFEQYDTSIALEVWGPLGQGRTRLAGNEQRLQLTQGDKTLAAGPAAELMQQQLGWYVPLNVFSAWLQGQPHPDFPVDWRLQDSQQQRFVQLDWEVEFSRFGSAPEGQPGRISATKQGLRVLLVTRS